MSSYVTPPPLPHSQDKLEISYALAQSAKLS
jgi:hypothetical protein